MISKLIMKLELSKKHTRCIQEAINQSNKSPCAQRHGCVIAGGGKILGQGFNNYRTQFNDKINRNCTSCHAEIHAIKNCKHNKVNLKVAEEYIICS